MHIWIIGSRKGWVTEPKQKFTISRWGRVFIKYIEFIVTSAYMRPPWEHNAAFRVVYWHQPGNWTSPQYIVWTSLYIFYSSLFECPPHWMTTRSTHSPRPTGTCEARSRRKYDERPIASASSNESIQHIIMSLPVSVLGLAHPGGFIIILKSWYK